MKSLWEGGNTHEFPNPETSEELDPTEDANLEGKGSIGHSVPDAKLPEKREAWVNENDSTEVVRMTQDELDESEGEAPNNTASLTEDSSVMSSETVSKEKRTPYSVPVASEEKLEDQSGKSDQEHSQKSEQRPPSDAKASMASEEAPRKKPTRRGGRGRKPNGPGPRHNENANRTPEKQKSSAGNATQGKNTPTRSRHQKGSDDFKGDVPNADRTPEKQEKSSAANATKGKNTPTRSRHPKGYDDFKGDVPNADRTPEKQEKASVGNPTKSKNTPTRSRHPKGNDDFAGDAPKASPKNPRAERPEGSQGDAQGAHGGAESTPRQLPKTVETSEKSGGKKGTPDANKQDHVKNTRTGNPANSPGDSSKGGAPNRGRRRPRSRTSKGSPGDAKQDTRNRSNSTPEKRPPKNP